MVLTHLEEVHQHVALEDKRPAMVLSKVIPVQGRPAQQMHLLAAKTERIVTYGNPCRFIW